MLARALQDTVDGILISGGTGSAYTLSPNRSFTASATMPNGAEFFVRWHAACADTPTLNVDTTDARKIFWPDGTTLSASDILANTQGRVKYNTSLSAWVLMDAPVPQKNNLGHIINGKSLTTTITGSAFIPILSKATGEVHRFLKATLTPAPATLLTVGTADTTLNGTTGTTFGSLPAGIKRVLITFSAVSVDDTDNLLIQIGDSGGLHTTSYVSAAKRDGSGVTSTSGFIIAAGDAAAAHTGMMFLTNITGNIWVSSHTTIDEVAAGNMSVGGGTVTLDSALTQIALLDTGGDNFDGGSVNIMYEV
jgi:hypothetical protein